MEVRKMADWLSIKSDYDAMSKEAAKRVADLIEQNNDKGKPTVLGLATGSTPTGLYEKLVEMYEKGQIDFSNVTTFNLDNYWPCDEAHEKSYVKEMNEKQFDRISVGERGIKQKNINVPYLHKDATDAEVTAYCDAYEDKIRSVDGIDLQIVGIGENGHIGFNEPEHLTPDTPWYRLNTRKLGLSEDTIRVNELEDTGITSAISMGINTIMQAKSVLLLASGPKKAKIIADTFPKKGMNLESPAGILAGHEQAYLLIDEAAASRISPRTQFTQGEVVMPGKGTISRG
jgi:glucosamine-6-phosphate deaminase